ncbi:hypothetical protein GOODEAATRI_011771 [Goodea atripinnis]|uniref:Uncharacterized protein n=1 Tax=Goodea atripinnis TaxID=208336 RepID=A0ABV0N3R2_9TELE
MVDCLPWIMLGLRFAEEDLGASPAELVVTAQTSCCGYPSSMVLTNCCPLLRNSHQLSELKYSSAPPCRPQPRPQFRAFRGLYIVIGLCCL